MILDGTVTATTDKVKTYSLHANCYWVTIKYKDKIVFDRRPQNDDWLDPKHRKITDALAALEKALLEAV